MRVAFVGGGQPRFTPDILDLFQQLQGIDCADIYMTLWRTNWAEDDYTARKKIERILPKHWNLASIIVIDEPVYSFPEGTPSLELPRPENVAWWYKRCFNQAYSMALSADMINPKDYNAVTRFRGDSSLDCYLNYKSLPIDDRIIIPNNATSGWPDYPFLDLFFIGNTDSMMKFFTLGKNFKEYVLLADPNWHQNPIGSWRGEWLSGTFLKHNNIKTVKGPFNCRMNTYGKSRFTDKHHHLPIAKDPTEL